MNEYQVKVYFASGRISHNIATLIKGDYNSSKLVFTFDDDSGVNMFELLKPDGETKRIKEIVNNEIVLSDTNELGETVPLLTQAGSYVFEVVKYNGDSKLTSARSKFKVKEEGIDNSDIVIEESSKTDLDDLLNDVAKAIEENTTATDNAKTQAKYAKEQGDYAKEQASNVIKANEEANKIVSGFETNVNKYTSDFNKNAESKENSYNENASAKLKEYNDNTVEKTTAFDTNATNKTTEFNKNVETKINEFNSNATSKTEEYNTNAEAKVNEFNANVDDLIQDVEDCYNNMLTNEVEGTSIHVEDSANARVLVLENEGNCKQKTTTGKQLYDITDIKSTLNVNKIDEDGWITVSLDNSQGTNRMYFDAKTNVNQLVEVGRTYAVVVEIKEVSGTGEIYFCANQSIAQVNANLGGRISDMSVGTTVSKIPMKNDFSNVNNFLNTYGSLGVGEKYSITFRLSVLEDTTITPETFVYEKYTGGQPSPNPDYPQDVEVVEAYNLLPTTLQTAKTSGIDITKNKDNSYLLNGTATEEFNICWFEGELVLPKGEYYIGLGTPTNSFNLYFKTKDGTNTIIQEAALTSYTKFVADKDIVITQLRSWITAGKSLNNVTFYPMIIKGKTIKPYAPYGCIRNKSVGKNFIGQDNISELSTATGTFTGTTLNYSSSGTYKKVEWFIPVKAGEKFTFSCDENSNLYIGIFEYNAISTNSSNRLRTILWDEVLDSSHNNVSFTVQNDGYLRLYIGSTTSQTTTLGNLMLEKGETKTTESEPYQENTVDINLKGNFKGKIGDVKDTLRVENGRAILTKRIGKVVLDGSENWSTNENWNYTNTNVYISNVGLSSDSLMSNYFTYNAGAYALDKNGLMQRVWTTQLLLRIDNTIASNIDDFKTWLSKNPVTVYYQLAEPYEVDLGPVKMPKTFEGVTNISMIANIEGNMKLKYVQHTKSVINNLQNQINEITALLSTPTTSAMLLDNYQNELESEVV